MHALFAVLASFLAPSAPAPHPAPPAAAAPAPMAPATVHSGPVEAPTPTTTTSSSTTTTTTTTVPPAAPFECVVTVSSPAPVSFSPGPAVDGSCSQYQAEYPTARITERAYPVEIGAPTP